MGINPMKYYNVLERGTFYMKIEECEDITKLSDHFTTEDKMKELCGEDWSYWNHKQYFINNIIAAIEEWILIIPDKALSTTLTTRTARTLLLEVDTEQLRRCCPHGYSIKGSRIYNTINCDDRIVEKQEIEEKRQVMLTKEYEARPYEREQRITRDDCWTMQSAIRKAIEARYGVSIGHHSGCTHEQYIHFCKKLCNWPDIKRVIREWKVRKIYVQDIKWIKKIWDCPEVSTKFYP